MNQMSQNSELKAKLAAMVARMKEQKAAVLTIKSLPSPNCSSLCHPDEKCSISSNGECDVLKPQEIESEATDRFGQSIIYNEDQTEFIKTAASGASCVLIGAAGTGKTTCMKGVMNALISSGKAGILQAEGHKHLISETPGMVVVAFTRRAVANIRKNMPEEMKANCITIHKLLEYQPVYYTVMDETSGEEKTKMVFEPTRHAGNPLPDSISVIAFEESSMLGTDLYAKYKAALSHPVQEIFLGDIQQLPPVFGPAILGFKLLELPVVELTVVYRQALESPIIRLAHRILSGRGIDPEITPNPAYPAKGEPKSLYKFPEWNIPGKMTMRPWKKSIDSDNALNTLGQLFPALHKAGAYDPEEDMILMPFNKACGTIELNNKIANYLARARGALTYQIIAGFNRVHYSIGDKVLYDKEDATVIGIESNPAYSGAIPANPSTTLDYWGFEHDPTKTGSPHGEMSDQDMDVFLASVVANSAESGDRVRQCSHILTLRMNDSDVEIKVQRASDVNSLLLGYALTVHKSQGSEWRKVFCAFHQSHATMLQRELLYTAVTRAKEELYIICEPETFVNGIQSQRVKGDTLQEKAEFFKGKLSEGFELT